MEKKIIIKQADVFEALKDYPDNHFHGFLADAPYDLPGGFMGKDWDKSGIAFNVNTWKEVYRVLKPGAFFLCYGGTRTYHRMVCAIEDAGFEIRDCLMWLYGCVSEDTEILTSKGWMKWNEDIENASVLNYDIEKDDFFFEQPERVFRYDNKYPAYRIESDSTDQIVSTGHNTIVEREGKFVFQRAETWQSKESVPFLENLSDLPETIYDFQCHSSITKQDLFRRMYKKESEQNSNGEEENKSIENGSRVQDLSQEISEISMLCKESEGSLLLLSLCGDRESKESSKIFSEWKREEETTEIRREESGLEGGSNLLPETRKLQTDKIYKMPNRISIDGKERWLCNGTSIDNGSESKSMLIENGSSPSFESQPTGQSNRESKTIQEQSRTQTVRRSIATITKIDYQGKMWCVKTKVGAFVARRNGKIFITGNSGFPKSMDISKALDKMAGAEREVIGESNIHSRGDNTAFPKRPNETSAKESGRITEQNKPMITGPATDKAKLWDGYGTALKPSWEPIVLAMKPLAEKTYAENVTEWGTGGINIDGSRIATSDAWSRSEHNRTKEVFGKYNNIDQQSNSKGRWPANLLLTHHPDCVMIGIQKVKTTQGQRHGGGSSEIFPERGNGLGIILRDEDVEQWDCHPDCPIKQLNESVGIKKSGDNYSYPNGPGGKSQHYNSDKRSEEVRPNPTESNPKGRWPANLLLTHHPDCVMIGTKEVKGSGTSKKEHEGYEGESNTGMIRGKSSPNNQHDIGGKAIVEDWECHPDCPIGQLNESVGVKKSGDNCVRTKQGDGYHGNMGKAGDVQTAYGDSGFISRFFYNGKVSPKERSLGVKIASNHPTMKPIQLNQYLATLIRPPYGDEPLRLLNCFSGVCSEAIGAFFAGWQEIVCIEREKDYTNIGQARVAYWQQFNSYEDGLDEGSKQILYKKKIEGLPSLF